MIAAQESEKNGDQPSRKNLIPESFLCLSEASWRLNQIEVGIEAAQKAISLFLRAGDPLGAGRAYWSLASAYYRGESIADSRQNAMIALELGQQTGDQYGIGNALVAIGNIDLDFLAQLQNYQQAFQAFERAGNLERQLVARSNIAGIYSEIGLYHHGLRVAKDVKEIAYRMGSKGSLIYALNGEIEMEMMLGDLDSARTHLKEFIKLVPTMGDPIMALTLTGILGIWLWQKGTLKGS